YLDSDFDGDKENGVSTSSCLMNLGSTTISWISHKKYILVYYSTEAEYVVVAQATKEIIWILKILEDLQEKQKASTP
ncbi:Ty1/Copia family ribonuclease HI, partial [Escherichia coli]|nr:Ty1/Copia family ribonuclease HI [Escherichia coli]